MGCGSSSTQAKALSPSVAKQEVAQKSVKQQPTAVGEQKQGNEGANPNLLIASAGQKTPGKHEQSTLVPAAQAESRRPIYMRSTDFLRDFLESHGVDTRKFGTGTAKSLASLLQELRTSACGLEESGTLLKVCGDIVDIDKVGRKPRVNRAVEPVFIRIRWKGHVLVQESQELADGRRRTRRMFLAEKKEPRDGGGVIATVYRAIHEELGIAKEALAAEGVLRQRPDTYHFEIEQIDSASYPGLPSTYRTHYVQVDILEGGLPLFKHCGLPDCADFSTSEDSKLGTSTHFWRWYTVDDALREGIVKLPPQALNNQPMLGLSKIEVDSGHGSDQEASSDTEFRPVAANELPDAQALGLLLQKGGVDVKKFGVGKAKTLEALVKEVHKGESVLEWCPASCQIRRVVEPIFMQVRYHDKVCVEVEQILEDGRSRARNMLMAEKKAPEDQSIVAAVLRGMQEEWNLPEGTVLPDVTVRFRPDTYCCVAENLESGSYPGVACVYITHYCRVDILEGGIHLFGKHGLPLGENFETKEKDKLNKWQWKNVEEARRGGVKGFPKMQADDSKAEVASYERVPLEQGALGLANLRTLLEMGGVNVSAWGDYTTASLESLQHELEAQVSHLERNMGSGKVRRVLTSALVQLNVHSEPGEALEQAAEYSMGSLNRANSTNMSTLNTMSSNSTARAVFTEAKDMVNYRSDLACFEICHPDVLSYPGLECVHQTRLVQFEQQSMMPL